MIRGGKWIPVAESAYHRDLDKSENHFMPLVRQAIAQDDIGKARAIMDRIPPSIVKVIATDAIRHANGVEDL